MGKRIRETIKRIHGIVVPTNIVNRIQLSRYLRANIEHILNDTIRTGFCFCADNTRIFERFAILGNGKKQIWTQCDVCGRKIKNIKEEKGKNYEPINISKNNDYKFTYELSTGDFFCKVFAKLFAKHFIE
jgi:hypothetical protein